VPAIMLNDTSDDTIPYISQDYLRRLIKEYGC